MFQLTNWTEYDVALRHLLPLRLRCSSQIDHRHLNRSHALSGTAVLSLQLRFTSPESSRSLHLSTPTTLIHHAQEQRRIQNA